MYEKSGFLLVITMVFMVFAVIPSPLHAEDPMAILENHDPTDTGMGDSGTTPTSDIGAAPSQVQMAAALAALEAQVKEYEKLIAKLEDQVRKAEASATFEEKTGTVDVNTRLNIRSGPWGKIIGKFTDGNSVRIVGKEGDWFKIRYGDGFAYVHSYYVDAPGHASHQKTEPGTQPQASSTTPSSSTAQPSSTTQPPANPNSQTTPSSTATPKPEISGSRIYVDCPKRTQFEPANGQYQNSWCGPTALAMVYEYYGRKETTKQIASRIYVKGSGTSASSICSDAKKNGFPGSYLKESANIDFLKAQLKEGKPVIVNVDVNWKNGHHMVVVGFDGDKIIVNDPGRSVIRREFDVSWFVAQWNGRDRRCVVVQK